MLFLVILLFCVYGCELQLKLSVSNVFYGKNFQIEEEVEEEKERKGEEGNQDGDKRVKILESCQLNFRFI